MDSQANTFRLSESYDTSSVLRFIEDMGFTSRAQEYWVKNKLQAALCLSPNGDIVGAIPVHPRLLSLGDGQTIVTWHQTVVAVRPELRSTGIGTKLQDLLKREAVARNVPIMTVYRRDESSNAYRWYSKNGFEDVLPIRSLTAEPLVDVRISPLAFEVQNVEGNYQLNSEIQQFLSNTISENPCGIHKLPDVSLSELHKRGAYSSIYRYECVTLKSDGVIMALAILGVGKLHSDGERVEILLHKEREAMYFLELVQRIRNYAYDNNYSPVRIAISQLDPLLLPLCDLGFVDNWGFKFRVCAIDLIKLQSVLLPKNIRVHFKISNCEEESPAYGDLPIITLSYSQFILLMLFRLDFNYQVKQGLITYEGDSPQYNILARYFKSKFWLYSGIDYC